MEFRKSKEYLWKPDGEKSLDPRPVCFKLDSELKEQLRSIPDWQKRLRSELPGLIAKWRETDSPD